MKTKILFIYFLSCISFVLHSQENRTNVIQLNLGANNYRELILGIQIFNNSTFNGPTPVYFNGIRKGNCNSWIFCYPDTLYDKSVDFIIHETTQIDTLSRYIGFKSICKKDTLGDARLYFTNNDTTVIDATYLRTDTFPNSYEGYANGNAIYKTCLIDYYLLTSSQDKENLSSLEVTKNGFYLGDVDSSRYDTELEKYRDLVKKYPDSHHLIQLLDWSLDMFKSKNDVQKIFDGFSQENKNSFYGKRLSHYLTDNYFKNSILKAWDTGKSEAIVVDSAKYNLIIFSGFGCKPCLEEIPLLKKIYEDLSDKLDMTYVALDNFPKNIDGWRQIMRKENIPWRSVITEDDTDNIIEKYHVPAIPYCLFVHPSGGLMEQIDVRNTTELDYLYKTVQVEK